MSLKKLFDLYNLSIRLNPSKYFKRLAFLIYASALWALYNTSWSIVLQVIVAITLLSCLIRIFYCSFPYSHYLALHYGGGRWELETISQERLYFGKVRVLMNLRLFFFLELIAERQRKIIIVFTDQMSTEQFRALKWLEYEDREE